MRNLVNAKIPRKLRENTANAKFSHSQFDKAKQRVSKINHLCFLLFYCYGLSPKAWKKGVTVPQKIDRNA